MFILSVNIRSYFEADGPICFKALFKILVLSKFVAKTMFWSPKRSMHRHKIINPDHATTSVTLRGEQIKTTNWANFAVKLYLIKIRIESLCISERKFAPSNTPSYYSYSTIRLRKSHKYKPMWANQWHRLNLVKTFDGGLVWFVHIIKHSVAEASRFLGVSERTVERYISKFLVTGDLKLETIGRSYEERGTAFNWKKSVSFFCLRRQEPSDKRS